jgi:hypothetical protein
MIEFDLLRLGSNQKISIAEDVRTDLELDKILSVASKGDELVAKTWFDVLLSKKTSIEDVRYSRKQLRMPLQTEK